MKLTDHNHDKYITTLEFNTLAADIFNARLAQANSLLSHLLRPIMVLLQHEVIMVLKQE